MEDSDSKNWCRNVFALMRDGGIWGVPRSGLVFTKRGDSLVLTKILATQPKMVDFDYDYEVIKSHFEAAGIKVSRDVDSIVAIAPSFGKGDSNGEKS